MPNLLDEARAANQEHRGGGSALPRWREDLSREVDALAALVVPGASLLETVEVPYGATGAIGPVIPAGATIKEVRVRADVALTGVGPSFQVGRAGALALLANSALAVPDVVVGTAPLLTVIPQETAWGPNDREVVVSIVGANAGSGAVEVVFALAPPTATSPGTYGVTYARSAGGSAVSEIREVVGLVTVTSATPIPTGARIQEIRVYTDTTYTPGTTFAVGTAGTPGLLLAAADTAVFDDPAPQALEFPISDVAWPGGPLVLTIGGAPAVGAARVVVLYCASPLT